MDRSLQFFRDYPAVAGIGFFLLVSLFLAVVLGTAMHKAGASLKPLIFFFGFLAIVGGPQAAVHLLNAYLSKRVVFTKGADSAPAAPSAAPAPAKAASGLKPIPWDVVFGPKADPDLITDAKRGLDAILGEASEAKLSFNASGESALAARFPSAEAAAAALNRYGGFFQFAQVTGSDAVGWTARRYGGQGEWNHVVAAGNELYAWTGATRESVVANCARALGEFGGTPTVALSSAASGKKRLPEPAADWLRSRPALMAAFLGINLVLAVLWFFKASAWSARTEARTGARPADIVTLRESLLALNHQKDIPVTVTASDDGRALEINWRYADARWFDLMRVHRMKRTHKLVLTFDEAARKVRVTEYMSAFDASAGAGGLNLKWHAASGIQFFQVEHKRVFGAQLDENGRPTGELSKAYTFNLQELKAPVIEAVTGRGWTWQPVTWNAPASLRWLTE